MQGRPKIPGTCTPDPAVSRQRPPRRPGGQTALPGLILPVALALGCAREPVEDLPAAVAPETARLVSTVTSGTVSSRGPVKVRFTKPVVDGSLLDHPLKKRVFAFTPRIDGTACSPTSRCRRSAG